MDRWLLAALLAASLTAGAALWWWLARLRRRLTMWRRRRMGREGELKAPAILEAAGYRVLEEQPTFRCELLVDGTPHVYELRPDYCVARGDERFAAEVKTGKKAPDPLYSATRRQLLEYAVCVPIDGVLLVDMQEQQVRRVAWPTSPRASRAPTLKRLSAALAGAFVLGLLLGLILGSIG